ncbi:MAG TPA: rod shape-determining protein MreC [Alphaproteobacteria bacterium]|nr:rod shape-determining protein MreC [Alphaproteobacteria bacterium]HJM48609.1 rod shape-determining protein MreC [Alphaproteobacteria bacterium]
MRSQGGGLQRVTIPLRVVVQRFAYLLLVGAAVSLLLLGKTESRLLERLRTAIFDVAAPALEVLSQPAVAINRLVEEGRQISDLYGENKRLREENRRLHQWQAAAQRLEQENVAFRSLARVQAEPAKGFVSARVIADAASPFARTVLVNVGGRDDVKKNQAAVSGGALVGRVLEVGRRSSRVLLLTDLNSRVPVVVESTRQRGLLEGDNSNLLRLGFMLVTAQVASGDRIVTSGHGGVLPPGLPVGVITKVSEGGVRVQPLVRFDRLEYLSLVRYDVPGRDGPRERAGEVVERP